MISRDVQNPQPRARSLAAWPTASCWPYSIGWLFEPSIQSPQSICSHTRAASWCSATRTIPHPGEQEDCRCALLERDLPPRKKRKEKKSKSETLV